MERIDYTNYLRDKPLETDPEKIAVMEKAAMAALLDRGIHRAVTSYECYADGRVKVCINGKYYSMFNTNTGKFFSGCVGD